MVEKVELTDRRLRNLRPAANRQRYEIADTHIVGLRVRVGDGADDRGKASAVSFVLIARYPPSSNPTRRTLGTWPAMGLAEARERAKAWKATIARGIDPKVEVARARARAGLVDRRFDAVADLFLQRHVHAKGLITAKEIASAIAAVRPIFGALDVAEIKRRDLAAVLDDIEARRGSRASDKTLGILSKLFNWWAIRDDEFVSPIVRGMRRVSAKESARDRILADDETAALWRVTARLGAMGACCRLMLLTGQRRAKVAAMRWQDIDHDGTWSIPIERREKANARELRLPQLARDIIDAQIRVAGNPHVFAGRNGGSHLNGWSAARRVVDRNLADELQRPVAPWVFHDLRRTAKSLMARAGVRPDISERVLGHAIAGVEGVYDRHMYRAEKAEALEKLAALVERLIDPVDNVISIYR